MNKTSLPQSPMNHNAWVAPAIENNDLLPEILFVTSYPPRECGIATYSEDLIKVLRQKFGHSFKISICALESDGDTYMYGRDVEYVVNSDNSIEMMNLAETINQNPRIKLVMVQHEFGLFKKSFYFEHFVKSVFKPVILAFHTVLPNPKEDLQVSVQTMIHFSALVIVMTHTSADILVQEYDIAPERIQVIPHGTHLVPHLDKEVLKQKYDLTGKKILSTFGLLSSGKSIETTLHALPEICKEHPDVLFLVIGKTHPSVVKSEGEKYRKSLEEKVISLQLENHVRFINRYLDLPDLLEYLQLTDIYLFTSRDPHQAVSGTFAYALSCGCPIISTPIPHAREVLQKGEGIIVDFENPKQLTAAVRTLLGNEPRLHSIRFKGLHRMAPTAWENTAIAHALAFESLSEGKLTLQYNIPPINLDHVKKMTMSYGIVQFSIINQPDIDSGFTLDDNARAMVAMCQHYDLTQDETDLSYIATYLDFIGYCWQARGSFLNYVDQYGEFTLQNYETNLQDSNGRAVWALGYLISLADVLPDDLVQKAESIMNTALPTLIDIHSTRSMAFIIKGLYYSSRKRYTELGVSLLIQMSNRLVQMYKHESTPKWAWYESYLTYGNSILPEAMLCAWMATGNPEYKQIAKSSFDFLLSKIFSPKNIQVISNQGWLQKEDQGNRVTRGGEQPIDIAYTILALQKFYTVFQDESYEMKSRLAFDWFLGNNHLHQIIYNPCTGGCYDGLESTYVNLNQGAESTVSYLMARLTREKAIQASSVPILHEVFVPHHPILFQE